MRQATLLNHARLACSAMAVLVHAAPAFAEDAKAPTAPAAVVIAPATSLDDLKSRVKKINELVVEGDATLIGRPGPIAVEFKDSTRVALLVAEDLTRRGFPAVANTAGQPTTLRLSARVSMGGPAGRMAFDLGTMFEKVIAGKPAAEQAQIDPAQNVVFGATSYLRTAGLTRIGLFDPFLYRYFTVMAISDALGIHGAANKALTGDQRGICLINCDHWKDTLHWIIVDAVVVSGGEEQKSRAVMKAWLAEIDPQTAFDIAYQTLLQDGLLRKSQ